MRRKGILLDKIEREACDNEVKYWGCSQAVLDALQQNFKIGNREVFRSASALAGGVAAQKEVCGALLGAIMAIGLLYGRRKYNKGEIARESREYLEGHVRSHILCDRFREKFGSLRCSEVKRNVRGSTYKEYTRLDTLEALKDHDKCGNVTGATARMAAEIMLQPTDLFQDEMDALAVEVRTVRKQQKLNEPARKHRLI